MANINIQTNYCLKWQNYQTHVTCELHQLMKEESMVDVTLKAENETFHAHKIILSSCSPFFHEILSPIEKDCYPIIILDETSAADIRAILEFIYYGEIKVEGSSLTSVLKTADNLKITGLMEIENHFLNNPLDPSDYNSNNGSNKEIEVRITTPQKEKTFFLPNTLFTRSPLQSKNTPVQNVPSKSILSNSGFKPTPASTSLLNNSFKPSTLLSNTTFKLQQNPNNNKITKSLPILKTVGPISSNRPISSLEPKFVPLSSLVLNKPFVQLESIPPKLSLLSDSKTSFSNMSSLTSTTDNLPTIPTSRVAKSISLLDPTSIVSLSNLMAPKTLSLINPVSKDSSNDCIKFSISTNNTTTHSLVCSSMTSLNIPPLSMAPLTSNIPSLTSSIPSLTSSMPSLTSNMPSLTSSMPSLTPINTSTSPIVSPEDNNDEALQYFNLEKETVSLSNENMAKQPILTTNNSLEQRIKIECPVDDDDEMMETELAQFNGDTSSSNINEDECGGDDDNEDNSVFYFTNDEISNLIPNSKDDEHLIENNKDMYDPKSSSIEQALHECIVEHVPLSQVIKKYNLPKSTLYYRLRKLGGEFKSTSINMEKKLSEASNDVAAGATLRDASAKYGVSKSALWRHCTKSFGHKALSERSRSKYSREDMQGAVDGLKNGGSLTNLSKMYNIPFTTLHREKIRLMNSGDIPYEPPKEKTRYDKDETKQANLSKAIFMVRNKGMTTSMAACIFQVPKVTIWRKIQELNQTNANIDITEEDVSLDDTENYLLDHSDLKDDSEEMTVLNENSEEGIRFVLLKPGDVDIETDGKMFHWITQPLENSDSEK